MKFQIQNEVPGRLRVRCLAQEGRKVRSFDLEQGAAILGGLERVAGVRKVKLYSSAAGIAVFMNKIWQAITARGLLPPWPG